MYWKNLNLAERRIVMKFINTRKFTWIICIIGFLLALVSIFFLPSIIPVHFANGIADDYGRKIQIFLFPILQVLITFDWTRKSKILPDTFKNFLNGHSV